jgi:hypothetical protein
MVMPMTPEQIRLRRLIRAGYFPSELPPPFTTSTFAREAVQLAAKWDPSKIRKHWTSPEHFSVPRYGHVRRKLSIVNPINQLHVADLVSQHWADIRLRLQQSKITEFKPEIVLKGLGRAVSGVDFDGVSRRRAEILARYGRYVKTDIARFYPSVYTHSIAWAYFGKRWVKHNISSSVFKKSFANLLDKAVAAGQAGQTIGIPIGPDTSRILSELIATALEEEVVKQVADLDVRGVRYVDDMLIGFSDLETPDTILSKISAALYEYELELNGEKTSIHGLGYFHSPEWIQFIRGFQISNREDRQREELDSFFEQALHLSDSNRQDNVLLFAIKRAASFPIADKNRNHFLSWLLYAARRSSTCLSFVVEHLSFEYSQGRPLPLPELTDYIHQQLPMRADAAHTAEVAWLIFWARELGIQINAAALERVTSLRSGVNALLVLDMLQRGLIKGQIDISHWTSFATTSGLKSEMWLAAYEVTKKGWWPGQKSGGFITSHDFFGDLWHQDVEFYAPSRRARPRMRRPFFAQALKTNAGFDTLYPE